MTEKHPFGIFVPANAKYLLLGSFVAKEVKGYEWFYANGRNQFWSILEAVYARDLSDKEKQQALFCELGMAVTDIILECNRTKYSNLDTCLTDMVFNTEAITSALANNSITKIYFSSRFVEHLFRRYFKDLIHQFPKVELITLPSPSPRYAMLKMKKIEIGKLQEAYEL